MLKKIDFLKPEHETTSLRRKLIKAREKILKIIIGFRSVKVNFSLIGKMLTTSLIFRNSSRFLINFYGKAT